VPAPTAWQVTTTHLDFGAAVHGHVARRLAMLAEMSCAGRLVALGGGVYEPNTIGRAWCAVVEGLLTA